MAVLTPQLKQTQNVNSSIDISTEIYMEIPNTYLYLKAMVRYVVRYSLFEINILYWAVFTFDFLCLPQNCSKTIITNKYHDLDILAT